MSISNLQKRIGTLECRSQAKDELVPFSFQWLNEDGTPAGPLVRRKVPKMRLRALVDKKLPEPQALKREGLGLSDQNRSISYKKKNVIATMRDFLHIMSNLSIFVHLSMSPGQVEVKHESL
jgi:hypothetical protein